MTGPTTNARSALAAARAACLLETPHVFVRRADVPDPEPDVYVVIDAIANTPSIVFGGATDSSIKRIQVTVWSRRAIGPALDLQARLHQRMKAARFIWLAEGYPNDEEFEGCRADYRRA